MESFKKLGISEHILRVIAEENFIAPTEIQEKAVPLIMQGKDVIAGSATGSGKTLAFGSGIIQNSKRGAGVQALILTPTRELAEQVGSTLKKFSKYKELTISRVYGGVAIGPQITKLRRSEIVVGTPGRVLDHITRRTIDLSHVNFVVLDEADRMLDMGFIHDVTSILSECPKERQTILCSATITPEVSRLANRFMHSPVKVSAETYVDPSKLTQIFYEVSNNEKFSLLAHLLKNEKSKLVMVFCNTRRNTDFVAKHLQSLNINAMGIHGGLTQHKRTQIMERFKSKDSLILVCTDVAARGLDIPGVSHIYNYDIPQDSKQYVHRIGRTARAGKSGIAVNILSPRDHEFFRAVLRENNFRIEKEQLPEFEIKKIGYREERPRFRRPSFRPRSGPSRPRSGPSRPRSGPPRQSSRTSAWSKAVRSNESRPQRGYRPRSESREQRNYRPRNRDGPQTNYSGRSRGPRRSNQKKRREY